MNEKEPTGHFVPSSGFLNDGIKKWKPKEPTPSKYHICAECGHESMIVEKEPPEDYVLSADGYCRNLSGKTVVETADLELYFERLQYFLDVHLKGLFPYPNLYEDWNDQLEEDKEKYLAGDDKE